MISFVIPAHDEARNIGETIRALRAAAGSLGRPYEIVVADDASTDETGEIAASLGARVIRVEHRQIGATRNAGAAVAKGDPLVFVDADTIVPPATLRAALAALGRGAVGGGAEIRFDGRVPAWAAVVLPLLLGTFRVLGVACGCFVFCRRAAFEAVGGFDPAVFAGEEAVLSRALGRRGRFVILRETVLTSGRKLRTYTGREILRTLTRLAQGGIRGVRGRGGLELLYGERRPDR